MVTGEKTVATREENQFEVALSHLRIAIKYDYPPLPNETSFRLLELLPGKFEDEICMRLHVADWDFPPKYEAISYAWGNAAETVNCKCEGEAFQITKSLQDALIHFRYTTRSRFLWADAVCIHQEDKSEVNRQVKHMTNIYANAIRTLIWLGADQDNQAQVAMNTISRLSVNMLSRLDIYSELNWENYPDQRLYVMMLDGMVSQSDFIAAVDSVQPDEWTAVCWLYSRPWFSRLWVLRELHASRNAISASGTATINSLTLMFVSDLLVNIPNRIVNLRPAAFLYHSASMSDYRLNQSAYLLTSMMFHNIAKYKTSDVRDRVYAMLYLPYLEHIWTGLPIDYSAEDLEVYKGIVSRCFKHEHSLNVLGYVRDGDVLDPSWIPRWDVESKTDSIVKYRRELGASNGCPKMTPRMLGNELHLRGLEVATIKTLDISRYGYLGFQLYAPETMVQHASSIRAAWAKVFDLPTKYTTEDDFLTALHAVFIGTQEPVTGDNVSFLKRWIYTACGNQMPPHHLSRKDDDVHKLEPLTHAEFQRYVFSATTLCKGRQLFVTDTGHFGVGPSTMQLDDKLCILFGASVPFVLRCKDNGYTVVGESYCHEIMLGEMAARWKKGELKGIDAKDIILY